MRAGKCLPTATCQIVPAVPGKGRTRGNDERVKLLLASTVESYDWPCPEKMTSYRGVILSSIDRFATLQAGGTVLGIEVAAWFGQIVTYNKFSLSTFQTLNAFRHSIPLLVETTSEA